LGIFFPTALKSTFFSDFDYEIGAPPISSEMERLPVLERRNMEPLEMYFGPLMGTGSPNVTILWE
jgi:hypothetical protein